MSQFMFVIHFITQGKDFKSSSGMYAWQGLYLHPFDAESCAEVLPLQHVKEVQTVGISAH